MPWMSCVCRLGCGYLSASYRRTSKGSGLTQKNGLMSRQAVEKAIESLHERKSGSLGITVELAEKPVSCPANLLKTLSRVLSYISVCTATPKDPNLSPAFIEDIGTRLKLTFIPDGQGDLANTFGPEDVFNYVYAVMHSPTYRRRYAEFMKID